MKGEGGMLAEPLDCKCHQSKRDRKGGWVEVFQNALHSKEDLESIMRFRRKRGPSEESFPSMNGAHCDGFQISVLSRFLAQFCFL